MHLFPRLTALVKDTIVTTRLISRHCQKSTFLQWGTYGDLVKLESLTDTKLQPTVALVIDAEVSPNQANG